MGLVACQAAYEEGAEWLAQLKAYLEENRKFVKAYLEEHLPEIRLIEPEGTYLLWLDFKALHLNEKELEHLIVDKAHLWLARCSDRTARASSGSISHARGRRWRKR